MSKSNYWKQLKLERGQWLTTYPFGYKVEKVVQRTKYHKKGAVSINHDQAAIVQDIFNTFSLGGHSLTTLTAYINNKYAITMHRSLVARIIANKFYMGIIVWEGKEYPHIYPPIITKKVFDRCQFIKQLNNKYRLAPKEIDKTDVEFADYQNQIMDLCKNGITIEDLMAHVKMNPKELLEIVAGLALENKIEENEFGEWSLK